MNHLKVTTNVMSLAEAAFALQADEFPWGIMRLDVSLAQSLACETPRAALNGTSERPRFRMYHHVALEGSLAFEHCSTHMAKDKLVRVQLLVIENIHADIRREVAEITAEGFRPVGFPVLAEMVRSPKCFPAHLTQVIPGAAVDSEDMCPQGTFPTQDFTTLWT